MRYTLLAAAAAITFVAVPARADDKAECAAGIQMIKVEISKKPPQATLTKLQRALRIAEREDKEQEFVECVEAVEDARKALGR